MSRYVDHDAISNIAHWHHFPDGTLTLPCGRVAKMLGRKARHSAYQYSCNLSDDSITCGLDIVWKTGAREILHQLQEIVTLKDLDRRDYIKYLMWQSHVKNQKAAGYDMGHSEPDAVWRDGYKVADSWPEYERLAMQEAV